MKKPILYTLIFAALVICAYLVVQVTPKWEGVDDTVVGKYAEAAGRPAQKAFIDTNRGDLLLFFFLIAGAAAGFLGGYSYRELFAPQHSTESDPKVLN